MSEAWPGPELGMNPLRREFLQLAGMMLAGSHVPSGRLPAAPQQQGAEMFGLIGKIRTVPGQRDALAAILLQGTRDMPGCLSYVVAADPADADALWVTEVWDTAESHTASLALPAVQAAIGKGRPLIAAFDSRVETLPIGGHGLAPAAGR